ncbi:hypothetical protein, partial [Paenisporosarcina sp. TG20]|uniref:hypothetical protein n=1 Tax=Paenisporosarcina sp. TG20 TaxID=1211706 RepID=UPI001ED8CFAE
QASSGQQDVGHEGIASRCGVLNLRSICYLRGLTGLAFSAGVATFHYNHSPFKINSENNIVLKINIKNRSIL